MKAIRAIVFTFFPFLILASVPYPQVPPSGNAGAARGEYLVEEVVRCGECHTPKDAQGNWDQAKWLQGGGGMVPSDQAVSELGLFSPEACRPAKFL